jgi:hypothetical protein
MDPEFSPNNNTIRENVIGIKNKQNCSNRTTKYQSYTVGNRL